MRSTLAAHQSASFSGVAVSDVYWSMSTTASGADILNISGNLKPGWLGRLSSYLSLNTISIISGAARKCSSLCWDASFEIEARSSIPTPLKAFNPLPAIMTLDTRAAIPPLKISDFLIEHSTRHGGSLYTEISGKDCIGFLHGMLRIFSFYSLFPTELEVSTRGLLASDRFWLKGVGATAPSDDDLKSLHERLQQISEESLKMNNSRSSVIEFDTSRSLH